ncbi:MAG TPA: TonB-dependent receptor [Candidatus Eisenbacteria bacterium]|nr:TonB-dependent receptor [Candidatus Eisenbacteria bacterium]
MNAGTLLRWGRNYSLLAGLLALLFAAAPLRAQVDTGSILGTVTDASGAVVVGASVTLTNEGTGASLTTTTGTDGVYKFSPVKIGSYKIDVSTKGFQPVTAKGVVVNIGVDVVQNFSLKPGNVTQTIEVTAAAPLLESQSAAIGQVTDTRAVNDLPLNGRNFTFLAQLGAGVNTPQADTRGNAATGAFSANGLRPAQNNYLLDGIDNNSDTVDFLNGTNFVVLPPVDAVQEFRVETSNFSAEFGRSGAAVLNATIKSGTNEIHGSAWEFFRNDVLDAADFFENAGGIKKGALRQNQFGVTIGGPVVIPKVFNGRNKLFFFADYEGFRRVQGTVLTGSVPTDSEVNSGYTNFQDLITGQSGANVDNLGRSFANGTILDPASTRLLTAGSNDPVTGLPVLSTGYTRDPLSTTFGTAACPVTTASFGAANMNTCALNVIPVGRLDPNAVNLLKLYPAPTTSALFSNYANSPKLFEHSNSFDARLDGNFNDKNQAFFRFSLKDDPQFIPAIFGGVADGGGFQQGNQTANAQQSAFGYTHTFSPTLINELRLGFNYLHTTRSGPSSTDLSDLPSQYGIQDIPQTTLNGGLPAFGINGLATLGSNAFLPSDEVTSTFQLTDSVTKIWGKHTFKAGFEYQHVKFSTLQPPWSRGEFDYNGAFTDVPLTGSNGNTGRANFLLTPTVSTVPGGVDYVGGSSNIYISNISLTDNGKNYYGGFVQDDWKITPKLTLNLGLRYDFFGLVFEHHGAQANFVPNGAPLGGPAYIIPGDPTAVAAELSPSFVNLLTTDGIQLQITNKYGGGLGNTQGNNFAPRVGFAYQVTPKLVVRGGFGMFYNGFENRGFSPNLGENYPFQFNFNFFPANNGTPYIFQDPNNPGQPCPTAGPGGSATFETGFSCTPLEPTQVIANGLGLRGIQFNYQTPYNMGANLTVQYQLTNTIAAQVAYVNSLARHLESFPNSNLPSTIVGPNVGESTLVPFPDFGTGSSLAVTDGISNYHSLQTKIEKRFGSGLSLLATYTYSKVLSDAHDLLNGGSVGNTGGGNVNGYRAPNVPGFGIRADYALAPQDIRNVFHFSGSYDLPFGKGKRWASDAEGWRNQVVGGWSINWILTLQDGQPITIPCPTQTASGVACGALFVAGQSPKLGLHTDANGKLSWFGNPAAFTQPCVLDDSGTPIPNSPTGCVALTGTGALGGISQVAGPGYHRMDFSIFKNFPITERATLQFRTEFFNITNHPNFNAPGFGGNGVVAISGSTNFTNSNFGEIGSTRDAPYDPRQIQFALKLLF